MVFPRQGFSWFHFVTFNYMLDEETTKPCKPTAIMSDEIADFVQGFNIAI